MMGIFWGVMMFIAFLIWGAIRDHGIMPVWVVINLIIWPIGGALFGMLMYRWQNRQDAKDAK
jgi:apolipoprotein N-acyltransferase